MRLIVLTVDYEIFGNGSGDVRQHILDPAHRMAHLCQEHQVPLTVFFEAEEYVAFDQHAGQLQKDLGYDPAALIRNQIVSFIEEGHDVQLHLHPEWYGARYHAGRWFLHPDKNTVDSLFDTQASANDYIAKRKGLVEEMAAEARPGYKVRAYRAGAFSAQPGQKLLTALAANAIRIDSSVVKGLYHPNGGSCLDYRRAPSAKGPWRVIQNVLQPDASGQVWEFPTYSVMGRRWHQATLSRLRAKFSKNVPKDRQKQMVQQLRFGRNPVAWLRFLWQPVPIKLDFHNLSPVKALRWIKAAPKPENGLPDVVVLIGHTKEHIDDNAFAELLAGIAADPTLKVVSFDSVATSLCPTRNRTLEN